MNNIIKLDLGEPEHQPDLRKIAQFVKRAKKCLVITGAGISCSGGIPDFRSSTGLYSMIQSRYPGTFRSGRDLFDADLLQSDLSIEAFYAFMGILKEFVVNATPTPTHYFIKKLYDLGKLIRVYTQNIDNLEASVGLNVNWRADAKSAQVVQLHGTMEHLKCNSCTEDFLFVQKYCEIFKQGGAPQCPACEEREFERQKLGKRRHTIGRLKPSILLYGDSHPQGLQIGDIAARDEEKADCLIVMGTSLRIPGVKRLIKQFAKGVHTRNGKVLFINATDVAKKEWEGYIDYQVIGSSDEWVRFVEAEMESDSQRLTPPQSRKRQRPNDEEVVNVYVDNSRLPVDIASSSLGSLADFVKKAKIAMTKINNQKRDYDSTDNEMDSDKSKDDEEIQRPVLKRPRRKAAKPAVKQQTTITRSSKAKITKANSRTRATTQKAKPKHKVTAAKTRSSSSTIAKRVSENMKKRTAAASKKKELAKPIVLRKRPKRRT